MKRIAALLLCCAFLAPAFAQEAPDVLVKNVTLEVVELITKEKGNRAKIVSVIEEKVLPHFNFTAMTALAVGQNWGKASPEQKKRLTEEFRTLLVRTYSGALNQYRDQTFDFKPLRAEPGATDVIVKTEAMRQGQQPVQLDYGMTRKDGTWKVYDVIVGGVSLVTNYRDEFASQIQSGGTDGLIKALTAKNGGAAK